MKIKKEATVIGRWGQPGKSFDHMSNNMCFCFYGTAKFNRFFRGDHEEIAKYYKSGIVREIAKCDSKLVLLATSKSKILKDYAKMKTQKAKFLNVEKEMLIKEMILNPCLYWELI